MSFSGNSSFAAKGCAVYSNSTAQNSLSSQGSAAAEADAFCAVGGASGTFNPAAKTPCTTKDDPFVGLRRPVSVGCDYSSSNATSVAPNATKSFAPGTYCATLEIKGIATWRPEGASLVPGTGITFYLTGPSAGFTINGGGTLNLSAPRER